MTNIIMKNKQDKCREAFEAEFPLADLQKDARGRYTEPDTARLHVGFCKGYGCKLTTLRNLPFRDTLERSICTTVDDYDETLDVLAAAYNQLSEENERLRDALEEGNRALEFLRIEGYRRCNIAACNCPYWHGGAASERLSEIHELLSDAGYSPYAKTLYKAIEELIAKQALEANKGGEK